MNRPMNSRWILGGIAIVALGALIGWIARNTYWDEVSAPTFPRGEAAKNPFYAAQRFVEELGATSEWRRALGQLPPPDAVLMLTHWNWDLIESRREQLERWVESGGRLLVDSTIVGGTDAFDRWSGLTNEWPQEEEYEEEDLEAAKAFTPPEPCRELRLVHGEAQSEPARKYYSACAIETFGWLSAAREVDWALEDNDGYQALRVQIGAGSVTWINGIPFGNGQLLEAENGVLFVDAVELRRGDHVVFASEEEHASLLDLIWIYGSPAVLLAIVLIALALWRSSMRFGPLEAAPDASRRSLAEQIRGTGQFVLRVGGGRALHAAMVRAVHEAARLRIPGYERMPAGERITSIARVARLDAEKLAETVNYSGERRPHDFKNAIALLDTARSRVIAFDASPGRGDEVMR